MVSREIKAWDNYWKKGEINSCISGSNSEYQQQINQFWQDFFGGFEDHAILLDVGTGNGLLPVLAVDEANKKNLDWEIHGVDLADIDPEKYVDQWSEQLGQINFQGRIAAEDLPFEEGYFNGVTSQYAIEYGDLSRSIPEIYRILKRGGHFCGVFHARDSTVVQQNNEGIAEADFLLNSAIFQKCKDQLIKGYGGKITAPFEEYVRLVQALGNSFQAGRALNIIPRMQHSLLEILKLSKRYPLAQGIEMIDNAALRLEGHRAILADLVKCSLDKKQVDHLMSHMKSCGFDAVQMSDFRMGKKNILLGICMRAQKT